ncbi:hypothetical protein MNBD_GAMMA12-2832 [hydrothermal vent metagenome]|uniref:Uncharacterized protein n=1 Tax=hydrothermal vent metagenome TaxID=652676 RepID=A0A3B0YCV5_9ZZZZ
MQLWSNYTLDIEGKKNPGASDLLKVGLWYDLKKAKCKAIIQEVKEAVSQFIPLAKEYSVDKKTQKSGGKYWTNTYLVKSDMTCDIPNQA